MKKKNNNEDWIVENPHNKDLSVLNNSKTNYLIYRKKYIISRLTYIVISLVIMIISSLQILLNLFAIRWNETQLLKDLFLAVAILSAIVAFMQSILLFFDFKGSKEVEMAKLRNLQKLKDEYIANPESIKVSKVANQIYDISKKDNN
ncbi:hypothetical protein [Mycoplasma sp. 4044]